MRKGRQGQEKIRKKERDRFGREKENRASRKSTDQTNGRASSRTADQTGGRMGLKWAAAAFWLGVWVLSAAAVDNGILLASPWETAERMLSLLGDKSFYLAVGSSLLRIGAGFGIGLGLAVLLAAGSSRLPFLEDLLAPLMGLMKTVPVASFAVLLLIWWGPSGLAAAVSLLVVVPGVYFGTLEGLKSMDIRLLEMADVFRLPFWNRFFYLYRPELRPFLRGSIEAALGMCWKAGVAAEVIGIPARSIGEGLYLSKIYLDTAGVFAWTAAVVLVSFLMEKLLLAASGRFFAWEPRCAPPRPTERSGKGAEGVPSEGAGSVETGFGKAAPDMPFLQVQNITKSFGGRLVLENVNAVCRPGEVWWLTGASGSGKTTLLRILAGLTEPDSGRCTVPGACSMVFQEDRLCEEYSAVRNVTLVTGTGTEAGTEAEKALEALLGKDAVHKPCSQLSGGMKRRVALVRAMEADSACVLLDEPFTGMDGETRRLAREYIRRKREGRILVIASHEESLGAEALQGLSFHL